MHYRILFSCIAACAFVITTSGAEQLEAVPPLEGVATLHLPDDVEAQLIASEPVIEDPVAMAFGTNGELYVVENRGYPSDVDLNGRVALLRDRNGDGYYESRTTFASDFPFPNGVMPWKDGVLVTSAPTVYFLKDTDGDDVADVREDFLTGFKLGGSTQLYVSHPMLGLDNWLYFTNGLSGGEVTDPTHPDAPPVVMGSNDLRYNPLTRVLEATSGQAQFGQSFDNYGHRFVCTNRKHISQVVVQHSDLARNPYAGLHEVEDQIAGLGSETRLYALTEATTTAYSHAGTFTAACGLAIYRGTALPEAYRENGFTCDPTSNIVHRTVLSDDGPIYKGRRGEEDKEFLASTDNWFRPVFLTNGPDGALYLCDMYRKTIEHPQYLPKDVAEITDFQSGRKMGRIYRIAAKGNANAPEIFEANPAQPQPQALVALLGAENNWQRETAHRLLLTEYGADAPLVTALQATLTSSEVAFARLHALSLLEAKGALDESLLSRAIQDGDRNVREQAVRLARAQLAASPTLRAAVLGAATDSDARVRLQVALALGDLGTDETVKPLLHIAAENLASSWTRAAVLSGIQGQLAPFAMEFASATIGDEAAAILWIEPLARMVAQSQPAEATSALLAQLLRPAPDTLNTLRIASISGAAEGIRRNSAYDPGMPVLLHLTALTAQDPGASAAFASLVEKSQTLASDSSAPTVERIRAINLLGYASFDQAGERLANLLHPRETQEIHQAAVQALGMISDVRVANLLATEEAWGLFTTPIRKAALQTLLERPERTEVLIAALEKGSIPPWSIDPVSRNQLANHRDADLKARAVAVFSTLETSDRNAVYEEFKPVLEMKPDVVSGREVFKNNCARCHRFAEDGFDVGPDLTGIRSQPKESILLHIIKPNSEVLAGFENFVVETQNLETYSGIIVAENEATVTIRGAMGVENTVNRADIDRMSSASLSLMPEELEKVMSKQQMCDLIGFLKGEK